MLCFQDCVDMCDLAPGEAETIREKLTLAEIGEALTVCHKRSGGDERCCVMLRHVRFGSAPLPEVSCHFVYRRSGHFPVESFR